MKKLCSLILVVLVMVSVLSSCGKTVEKKDRLVAGLPNILKIGRDDCVACIEMNGILAEVEAELGDTVNIAKINTEDEPSAIKEYGIGAIPTTIFYDCNGNEKFRFQGVVEKDDIIAFVEECRPQ